MVALLLTLAACGEDYDGPSGIGNGGGSTTLFVGAWEYTRILDLQGDIEVSTTTWFFDEDLTCLQRVETELASEGILRTTERQCTWRVENTNLIVTWNDDQAVVPYPYEFPGTSGNELLLSDLLFERIA